MNSWLLKVQLCKVPKELVGGESISVLDDILFYLASFVSEE